MKANKIIYLGIFLLLLSTWANAQTTNTTLQKATLIVDKRVDYVYPTPGSTFCVNRTVVAGTTVVPKWSGDITLVSIDKVTYKNETYDIDVPIEGTCTYEEQYDYNKDEIGAKTPVDEKGCLGMKDCVWEAKNATCFCPRTVEYTCTTGYTKKQATREIPVYTSIKSTALTKSTTLTDVETKLSPTTQALTKEEYSIEKEGDGLTRFCFNTPAWNSGKTFSGEISYVVYTDIEYDVCESTWWNSTWLYREQINISTGVSSTLNNFPAYLKINTSTLISAGKMQPDCDDIRIADENGISVSHELEAFTCNTTSSVVWFKIPTTNGSNMIFYVYYGNNDSSNISNGKLVFNESYVGVWHLSDGVDSLDVNNLTTKMGSPTFSTTNCKFGRCLQLGDAEAIGKTTPTGLPTGAANYTMSAWGVAPTAHAGNGLMGYGTWATRQARSFYRDSGDSKMYQAFSDMNGGSSGVLGSLSTWTRYAATYTDAATDSAQLYWNLSSNNVSIATPISTNAGTLCVGHLASLCGSAGDEWNDGGGSDGQIDEVRISSVVRSADWLIAEYSQTYAIGDEETNSETPTITNITIVNLLEVDGEGNNSWSTDNTPNVLFNTTGSNLTYSCSLLINATTFMGTNASVVNNTNTNLTINTTLVDKTYNLTVNCTGNVTNSSGTFNFTIDTTAPTTTVSGVEFDNDSYTFGGVSRSTYINITLTCGDGSGIGCNSTLYCIDTTNACTPATAYSAVLTLNQEGTHYVRYRSNDSLNNTETIGNKTIIIDVDEPQYVSSQYTSILGTNLSSLTYLQSITSVSVNYTVNENISIANITASVVKPNTVTLFINLTPSTGTYTNTTNILLDTTGVWQIIFNATDAYNLSTIQTVNFSVARDNLTSVAEGIYGYDFDTIPTTTEMTANDQYDYYTAGLRMNWSVLNTSFSDLKTVINYTYNNVNILSFVKLYFGGNYSDNNTYTNTTCIEINQNLTVLGVPPYDSEITFYVIMLNTSQPLMQVNFTNTIAECIVNATGNKAPVYVDTNNTGLNENWVTYWNMSRLTGTNNTLLTQEKQLLRNQTSLTRIYYSLTNDTKMFAKNYHTNIITKLRGRPTITIQNYSEINGTGVFDVILFNNETSIQNITVNITSVSRTGKDVWDTVSKTLVEKDTDGMVTIEIPTNYYAMLYFEDLDHFTVNKLWLDGSNANTLFELNKTTSTYATFAIVGAYDGKIYLHDPTYAHYNQFFSHYEWINVSITNYTDYCNNGVIIIADKNSEAINASINCSNSTFGYVSVADYDDTDAWENAKKTEVANWMVNYSTNIFIDGLDTGASLPNFASRFTDIVDYIQVDYGKKAITNDYTAYKTAGVGGLGEYDMKESFCGRWDGAVENPTYSFEDFSIDLQRAEWAKTNSKKQLLMAFGNVTDSGKMMYCYAEYLVLFGTGSGSLFRYAQPNFQDQREIFTFNPGTELESTWSVSGSDYSRRYSNGVVHIYTNNNTWWFDNGKQINNLTMCGKFQNYASAAPQGTPILLVVNDNIPQNWTVSYTDIGANQWDSAIVCHEFKNVYTPNGSYRVNIYSSIRGNPAGINIYKSTSNRTGIFSYWENNVPSYPAIRDDEMTWTTYGRSGSNADYETTNFLLTLESNYTTTLQVDNVSSITQNNDNTTEEYNITLSSSKSYNLSIWSEIWEIPELTINKFYWVNTTTGVKTQITSINSTKCGDDDPIFSNNTINGVTDYGVCYTQDSENTTWRINVPHLSDQVIQLDADITPPDTSLTAIKNDSTTYTENTWTNLSYVNITLVCTDTGACNKTYYCNDTTDTCTPSTEYTNTFNISTQNRTYVRYRSTDDSGNNETTESFTIKIDTVDPYLQRQTQSPNDITSLILFTSLRVNLTYNTTDTSSEGDANTWIIFYKTNSSTSDCTNIVNGTVVCGWRNTTADTSTSDNANFSFGDNKVYPQTDLLEYQTFLRSTPKVNITLNTTNSWFKAKIENISTNKTYSFFEVMVNATANTTIQVFYCNNSYTSGNPVSSGNCVQLYVLPNSNLYNHSHSENSSHHVVPFTINSTSNTTNGVKVTPTSYFLIRGRNNPKVQIWGVLNVTTQNTAQTSTNSGSAWINQTFTPDMHIHQYDGTETFRYYSCQNDTAGNYNCTTESYDLIELGNLPPTAPAIISPTDTAYDNLTALNITYTPSESPNGYQISFYNISLLDSNEAYLLTIKSNNSNNLTYQWSWSGLVGGGIYYIQVKACDNNSLCSIGLSEAFILAPTTSNTTTTTTIPGGGDNPYNSANKTNTTLEYDVFYITPNTMIGSPTQAVLADNCVDYTIISRNPNGKTVVGIFIFGENYTLRDGTQIKSSEYIYTDVSHIEIPPLGMGKFQICGNYPKGEDRIFKGRVEVWSSDHQEVIDLEIRPPIDLISEGIKTLETPIWETPWLIIKNWHIVGVICITTLGIYLKKKKNTKRMLEFY